MSVVRKIAKKIPLLPVVYRALRSRYDRHRLESKSQEDIFTDIYRTNAFGGKDSVSGAGSDVYQTRIIIAELPRLLRALNVSTMLDIPCGDFHWMKSVDLSGVDYTGADIVGELIEKNRASYAREGVRFEQLNLTKDELPKVDLVFCRDCLVHLSFADITLALENICNSQSEYLLTTTFVGRRENDDIPTGSWRTLNLELSPFLLPKPLEVIDEEYTEENGGYRDKALGLWSVREIRESLTRRHT